MSAHRMGPVSRSAHTSLKAQGLNLQDRPTEDLPQLPQDITSLGDEDLMALYVQMTAWADFAAHQLACAIIDEKDAERKADQVERSLFLQARAQNAAVTDARTFAKDNISTVQARDLAFEAEAYRKLVESIAATCERSAAVVSRELTRRTSSSDRGRRQGSWTT